LSNIEFVKAHACGNDFLVIDEAVAQGRHAEIARKLCARNTGIGADGIEFVDFEKPDGTIFLRLFNADGSEAELSGNGTRCVAAWLAASEDRKQVALGTHGGVRNCRVVERKGSEWWIESGMGVPRVMPRKIEIPGVTGTIDGAMVNVGNPHYVIFVDNDEFRSHGLAWQELGEKISTNPLFKHGTNVEFVRMLQRDQIAFRIYERGCGPTTCTGTCASSAAAIALKNAPDALTAIAQGGAQRVVWHGHNAEMLLTGPAEIICTGEVEF
jgi:diaminopimelate epimerase